MFKESNFSGGLNNAGNEYHAPVHITQNNTCHDRSHSNALNALKLTDPRIDRQEVWARKNRLLADTCEWVCHDEAFRTWWDAGQDDASSHLLWLHGDAGKGKTMMLIALCDEIETRLTSISSQTSRPRLAYYFCQSASNKHNSASAILRGLIYSLVLEQPELQRYVEEVYRDSERQVFEDNRAIHTLWRLLQDVVLDSSVEQAYLLVDALDECDHGVTQLLGLLTRQDLHGTYKIKWLLSSRNDALITRALRSNADGRNISLEVNAARVAKAIDDYIEHNVKELQKDLYLDDKTRNFICEYLKANADGTFLWVSLVCHELKNTSPSEEPEDEVQKYPTGLNSMYKRMMQRMQAIKTRSDLILCETLLRTVEVSPKSLSYQEAYFLTGFTSRRLQRPELFENLAMHCGSFLVTRQNRLYFVHKSALDFIRSEDGGGCLSITSATAHADISERCLQLLLEHLHQDMCGLSEPGYLMENVTEEQVASSLSPEIQYACLYWAFHLLEALKRRCLVTAHLQLLASFLDHKLLFWMECLSLLRNVSGGIRYLIDLEQSLRIPQPKGTWSRGVKRGALVEATYDARRFLSEFQRGIELAPLQVYYAGLVFCPTQTSIHRNYGHLQASFSLAPRWSKWSACLHTLEGHRSAVTCVALSTKQDKIASGSRDCEVRIWDAVTGALLGILVGHTETIEAVIFSDTDEQIFTASRDGSIRIWDPSTLTLMKTLEKLSPFTHLSYSTGMQRLASAGVDCTIRIWSVPDSSLCHTMEGHSDSITSLSFSYDGSLLASSSEDRTIRIWSVSDGSPRRVLHGHSSSVGSIMFSGNGKRIASVSDDSTVPIWDSQSGKSLHDLAGQMNSVSCIAFSTVSELLASGSDDGIIRLWNAATGTLLDIIAGDQDSIQLLKFSQNGETLASSSTGLSVRVWAVSGMKLSHLLEGHSATIRSLVFSNDGKQLVSGSNDSTIRIWNLCSNESTEMLGSYRFQVSVITMSSDGTLVATGSLGGKLHVLDSSTGLIRHSLRQKGIFVYLAFSSDSALLASASSGGGLYVWNTSTGMQHLCLAGESNRVCVLAFSRDGRMLAAGLLDSSIRIWSMATGDLIESILQDHPQRRHMEGALEWLLAAVGWNDHSGQLDSLVPTLRLSSNGRWLLQNGVRCLWIPPSTRANLALHGDYYNASNVGNTYAIGTAHGKVYIIKANADSASRS